MAGGVVSMSGEEGERAFVVRHAIEGRLSQREASERLGIGVRRFRRDAGGGEAGGAGPDQDIDRDGAPAPDRTRPVAAEEATCQARVPTARAPPAIRRADPDRREPARAREGAGRDVGLARRHADQHDEARRPLDQRADGARPLGAKDKVALAVAGDRAALDFLGPVLDVGHGDQLAAQLAALRLAAAGGLGAAQAADRLAPQFAARQGVDRLVRHAKAGFPLRSRVLPPAAARDLLRRPARPQKAGRFGEKRAVTRHPRLAPGQLPLGCRSCFGCFRPVPVAASVPVDLVRDRARLASGRSSGCPSRRASAGLWSVASTRYVRFT